MPESEPRRRPRPRRPALIVGTSFALAALALALLPAPALASAAHPTAGGATVRAAGERSAGSPAGVGDFYAVNDTTQHVVRIDLRHGRWTVTRVGPTTTGAEKLAVTRAGVVWVTASEGTLYRLDRTGRRRTIRLPRVGDLEQLTVDRHGSAYLTTGNGRLIRVSATGRTVRVLGRVTGMAAGTTPEGLGVDGSGRATVAYEGSWWEDPVFGTYNLRLATFGPRGGRPSVRKVEEFSDSSIRQFSEAPDGSVVIRIEWVGGSGIISAVRYAPGSAVGTDPQTKIADNAVAFDPAGRLYLMENRTFCPLPGRGAGECDPPDDPAVDRSLVYPVGGGTPRTIPISDLDIPLAGIAVDRAGRILASVPYDGPWHGEDEPGQLSVVPDRRGGRAVPILRGDFRELQTPR